MTPLIQLQQTTAAILFVLLLTCLGFSPAAQAVVPPPDGGYPNFTTAEGQNALKNLTTGAGNTAVGWFSLFSATTASFNTGVGAGTLALNTGDNNTATGTAALFLNTGGFSNTAVGSTALLHNNTGHSNTASGFGALQSNTTGSSNTANGASALSDNTTGNGNTANGISALLSNITGALKTAVGAGAGANITGSGNVCIGQGVLGEAGVDDTTYIRNVYNSQATARIVYVNSNNKIGTLSSSRRYKEDVRSMDKASEALFALKPVRFRYKKEIDRFRTPQFGLVAEDVVKVNPDLVTQDENGEPEAVRYDAINAMLLNEFLKKHRKFEEQEQKVLKQEATIAKQQKQIEALTAGLQKLTVRLELSRQAAQTALNGQ